MADKSYIDRLKHDALLWPNDATHYIQHESSDHGNFYVEKECLYKELADTPRRWLKPAGGHLVVHPRPVEASSRSDEPPHYIPAYGTRCEAVWLDMPDGGDRDWTLVVFKGHYINSDGTEQVWFSVEATGENIVRDVRDCEIRPRRTEKQKRRDDLAALITEANEHDTEPGYVASCIMMRYELMEKKKGAPPPWER